MSEPAFSTGLLEQARLMNTTEEEGHEDVRRIIQEAEQKVRTRPEEAGFYQERLLKLSLLLRALPSSSAARIPHPVPCPKAWVLATKALSLLLTGLLSLCSLQHCSICGRMGATITCAETGCEHHFHLPCAQEGECVTQYFGEYSSFCQEHSPRQAVEAAPEQNAACIICMEPVGDGKSYHTLVCPACKHAWFHRSCIQGQATCAGIDCFRCPLCRDVDDFLPDMFVMGIRIPLSGPIWEVGQAYASLGLRHERCDASECLYPHGREQAEGEGPWELLLCSSCAAEGTHRRCSYLSNTTDAWECETCAGVGTDSSVNSELTSPSTDSQAASGPVHSSHVPESGSQSFESGPEQGGGDAAAPRGAAERRTPTSARRRASASSRSSRAVGSRGSGQGESTRTRSRSPVDRRPAESRSQPQRHRRRRSRR
ncbi:UNVERIFIED_CONTAM: hypothetical protein H355_005367 [Colinus virginianus]|nr:hypothetical protein H355_005367 [Colinus virginianus]